MHHRAQQVLKSLVSSGPFQVDTYISNPSLNMQSVYWRAVKYDFEKRSFNLINATTDQPGAPASRVCFIASLLAPWLCVSTVVLLQDFITRQHTKSLFGLK